MSGVRGAAEAGQASIEMIAWLPALLLAAALCLQLLVAGYSMTLADGAAEAGALALAQGASPSRAARAALPGWAKDGVEVVSRSGRVTVTVVPPSLLAPVSEALSVSSSAWARGIEDG